jgi:hypothetical protein
MGDGDDKAGCEGVGMRTESPCNLSTGNAAELIQAMLQPGLDVAEDNVDRELHGQMV